MKSAKKRSPTRRSRVFTVSFPEEMARQVEVIAKEESRTISELFREAFRAYTIERRNQRLDRIRAEVSKRGPSPYTEDDVEALVHEVRSEIYNRSRRKTA
jgi:metal-responsive CopG/Arc/MetJ family transcriptional regulator